MPQADGRFRITWFFYVHRAVRYRKFARKFAGSLSHDCDREPNHRRDDSTGTGHLGTD